MTVEDISAAAQMWKTERPPSVPRISMITDAATHDPFDFELSRWTPQPERSREGQG